MQGEWFFVHLEGEMLHTSTVRILYIDLASHHGLLACIEEDRVIASEHVDHRIGDHELIPLFERLLGVAGWKPADLTQIACVTGPGGFMSLRVAVAFANTLIHQLQIPGMGIHLSDLFVPRVPEQNFLWLHSTKKHELFVRGFGKFQNIWPDATHVTVEEFTEKMDSLTRRSAPPSPGGRGNKEPTFFTGELIPEHEALFKGKELSPLTLQPLQDILPAFLARQHYEQKLLEPWYGRGW